MDRLLEALPLMRPRGRVHEALKSLSLSVGKGEVVGVIGRNGAGKSTLLQIICGTLSPSTGTVKVCGRVAALLELGSGFNPEFTGRENVYLNGAILGLQRAEIDARFNDIWAFSEIGEAMDQPVKTYSSGMFMRLAFAVAVSVDPDILVIDEALSVGDGAFARKSFDRIMQLKEQGKTIFFCSHNLYQVEAICNRALWIHEGQVAAMGQPVEVIHLYERFLHALEVDSAARPVYEIAPMGALPRFTHVEVRVDDVLASLNDIPEGVTGHSTLVVEARWWCPEGMQAPSFAVTVHAADARMVGSAGSHVDQVPLACHDGEGCARVCFNALPLLKGEYWVEVYLLCERGVMFYDQRVPAARFRMVSPDFSLEQGVVHLQRRWL
ncbi:MAG: ABC transporter ATP-binding protein [Halothiobacillaceae bacterium]